MSCVISEKRTQANYNLIGWREWVSLPDLGIKRIKAKIDTGARTSALHAFSLHAFKRKGVRKVRFSIHPMQRNLKKVVSCEADIIDQRIVCDSGGHRQRRYVIRTTLALGTESWPIELTLTNRDPMLFRMLLGRNALNNRFLILPTASYLLGKRIT